MAARSLQTELKKKHGFDSIEQEAMLSILRTSDLLENRLARLLRQYDLTPSQYNAMRILRGEGQPMPCLEIAERMIQVAPAITRVVDQLVEREWIAKDQSEEDRRVYLVRLTARGKALLRRLDRPILQLHDSLLGHFRRGDLQKLISILQSARDHVAEEAAGR
ncbi:MarR family transcriptional regulator [Roseiconus nitratireducens]|uniref:MarR family transcriptional regulator n=1 Tax=Roseiconus nitratireducens TaxID=2605748 RepID=A0A5M6CYK7_9BACT|nr:MarR family transcriptional regulator [Roseiconus nitratireducens]KAA5539082.1 MarR family transcriptional regulator [Roseiconus nitratireducens]